MAQSEDECDEEARELARELVRTARARRRLLDHELTRRRILLALTVVFALGGLVLIVVGRGTVGVTALVSATASGTATVSGGRPRS